MYMLRRGLFQNRFFARDKKYDGPSKYPQPREYPSPLSIDGVGFVQMQWRDASLGIKRLGLFDDVSIGFDKEAHTGIGISNHRASPFYGLHRCQHGMYWPTAMTALYQWSTAKVVLHCCQAGMVWPQACAGTGILVDAPQLSFQL